MDKSATPLTPGTPVDPREVVGHAASSPQSRAVKARMQADAARRADDDAQPDA